MVELGRAVGGAEGVFGGELDEGEGEEEEGSVGGVDSFSGDDRSGPGVEGRLTDGMKANASQVQAENGCSELGIYAWLLSSGEGAGQSCIGDSGDVTCCVVKKSADIDPPERLMILS